MSHTCGYKRGSDGSICGASAEFNVRYWWTDSIRSNRKHICRRHVDRQVRRLVLGDTIAKVIVYLDDSATTVPDGAAPAGVSDPGATPPGQD